MDIDDTLEIDIENKYINDKEKTKFTIEEAIYILKRKDFCDEVENIAIQTLLSELEKNNKIYNFCRRELAFERRLKREKRKPDEFNQGRFYVCENIKEILTNKVEESEK